MERVMESAKPAQENLRSLVTSAAGMRNGITVLSNETLAKIFEIAYYAEAKADDGLEGYSYGGKIQSYRRAVPSDLLLSPPVSHPQLAFTSVCRRFREVVLRLPTLWCHIQTSGCHWPVEWITILLDRSGDQPLTIELHHQSPDIDLDEKLENCAEMNPDLCAAAFKKIVDHSYRWKSVQISCMDYLDTVSGLVTTLSNLHLPLLQKLDIIRVTCDKWASLVLPTWTMPNLRLLQSGVGMPELNLSRKLDVLDVADYEPDAPNAKNLFRFLRSPNISSICDLNLSINVDVDPVTQPIVMATKSVPLQFQQLRTFSLSLYGLQIYGGCDVFSTVLRDVEMPHLEQLMLRVEGDDEGLANLRLWTRWMGSRIPECLRYVSILFLGFYGSGPDGNGVFSSRVDMRVKDVARKHLDAWERQLLKSRSSLPEIRAAITEIESGIHEIFR